MKPQLTVFMAVMLGALGACSPDNQQAVGFRLPQGSVDKGQAAFVALNCRTCHTVKGVALPPAPSPGQHNVILGGEVLKVKSYGELVTAVIHPAHDIAKGFDIAKVEGQLSPMPEYNHVMTVEQMIDVVEFLHAHYKKRPPETYYYYGM